MDDLDAHEPDRVLVGERSRPLASVRPYREGVELFDIRFNPDKAVEAYVHYDDLDELMSKLEAEDILELPGRRVLCAKKSDMATSGEFWIHSVEFKGGEWCVDSITRKKSTGGDASTKRRPSRSCLSAC